MNAPFWALTLPEVPIPRIEPRKSLSATAYRLHYVTHVIQGEVDEIESAITEEERGHPNIQLMAKMLQELTQAQEKIYATIHKLPPFDVATQTSK